MNPSLESGTSRSLGAFSIIDFLIKIQARPFNNSLAPWLSPNDPGSTAQSSRRWTITTLQLYRAESCIPERSAWSSWTERRVDCLELEENDNKKISYRGKEKCRQIRKYEKSSCTRQTGKANEI